MRRHRTVMADSTDTMTQEGAAAARVESSELDFWGYSYSHSYIRSSTETKTSSAMDISF